MKALFHILLCLALTASSLRADDETTATDNPPGRQSSEALAELTNAQPKLLRISARVDGSGRMVFTRDSVCYKHNFWDQPTNVIFDGELWLDLSQTPPAWSDMVGHLDLTKARIVKRKGRDVIALEETPDGFDLYLCDSPNGSADYEVVIAIPRRN